MLGEQAAQLGDSEGAKLENQVLNRRQGGNRCWNFTSRPQRDFQAPFLTRAGGYLEFITKFNLQIRHLHMSATRPLICRLCLTGVSRPGAGGKAITLAHANSMAEKKLDNLTAIVPKESEFAVPGAELDYESAAHSLTILRFHVGNN